MSGVVFQVKEASAHRDVGGKPIYFCCETCANYFAEHAEHVISLRGLTRTE